MATGSGAASATPLFLIILEEAPPAESSQLLQAAEGQDISRANDSETDTDTLIKELKQELRTKEEYLQTTNEELETTNEELKSSNEEMQSVNEELQSTNEELETSKEELQSVNEELSTVNAELQAKVADLLRTNNDMNNLLAGTGIATIFVDHQLRVLRFTPTANRIINLIPSDVGRPVSHVVTNLVDYDSMAADAKAVLDTLVPREVNVQTTAGEWYTMRIQPYRTLDNVIEGAVLTFVDISRIKQIESELSQSKTKTQPTHEELRVCGWEWDVQKKTAFWTKGMYRLHDIEPGEPMPVTNSMPINIDCYRFEDRPVMKKAFQRCVDQGEPFDLKCAFTTAKGKQLRVRTVAEAVMEGGNVVRVIGFIMVITEPISQGCLE